MTRVPEIGAVASLFALAIALPIWSMTSTTPSLAHQEGDLAPVEVGAGPIREQSLGFTGRNLYSGESVELFGYLTAVIGLERSLLFTDADAAPSPQTARFTYAGSVSNATRVDRADVTTIAGDGVLRIYARTTPPALPGMIPVPLPLESRSPSMRSVRWRHCTDKRPGSASSLATGS